MFRNKRAVVVIILGIILAAVALNRFYYYIQLDHWTAQQKAVQAAKKGAGITQVDRIDSYVWDEAYYVVTGKNKDGEQLLVWMREDGSRLEWELASHGSNRQQIRNLVEGRSPGAAILRIQPGKMKGAYVWEVFYKYNDGSGERYFYDFYQWKDAKYIVTYKMSKH
ncbi:cell wall elongation regulator TseB-like domain-containing protein [Paenibacillus gansuensis]|uniref:DUF5590 domain-containing protein n=1 Tax=Paenibacillus gansuensis TaxID=306542 RepID=A0ABW5P9V7_9BACL